MSSCFRSFFDQVIIDRTNTELVLREIVVTLELIMEVGDFVPVTGDFARAGQAANPGTHGGILPKSAFKL